MRTLWMKPVAAAAVLLAGAVALVDGNGAVGSAEAQDHPASEPLLIVAPRVFDGARMRTGVAVLVHGGRIAKLAPRGEIDAPGAREISIPGGTVLPGFIDAHTHHLVNGVPAARAVEHGVTTARDLGGPVVDSAGPGLLRQLGSGPIITPRRGYPLPVFSPQAGVAVAGPRQARATTRHLIRQGAKAISVSLEPGGSPGAPWSHHTPSVQPPWPVLGKRELAAVVAVAHRSKLPVVAYLSNAAGVRRALAAGVDEWAHMPCDPLPRKLARKAGRSRVVISGTLDTLSGCRGSAVNAKRLVASGARLLYATDLGHVDVPHGIDAQEIHHMIGAGLTPAAALAAATGQAGTVLGLAPLGRIVPGAPADLIAVNGDPRVVLKELEYPNLVVAGGAVVVHDPVRDGGAPQHPHH